MLPVPFSAALLIPATASRLHANVVPPVVLVAVYVNVVPLVAVADKLLDNTGIVLGAVTLLCGGLVQSFMVCVTV